MYQIVQGIGETRYRSVRADNMAGPCTGGPFRSDTYSAFGRIDSENRMSSSICICPQIWDSERSGGLAHGLRCTSAEAGQFHMYAAQLHDSAASMQLSMQADQIPEAPTSKHEAEISGVVSRDWLSYRGG